MDSRLDPTLDPRLDPTLGVTVHPGFNALYYSFYIEGLRRTVSRRRLRFSATGFPRFSDHCLALRVTTDRDPDLATKIYISASDGPGLAAEGLEWCDVYAKVNLDSDRADTRDRQKLFAIGPSFPIKVWPLIPAWWRAGVHFARCRAQVRSSREHFANYRRQYRYRLTESSYRAGRSDPGYVFGAARLWSKEAQTNRFRANFFDACKRVDGFEFEGGFIRRTRGEVPGFDRHTIDRSFSLSEYRTRVERSAVAFNTPAVSGCHGWKLGEFLALGKAIVSTPLSRELPAPMTHGEVIHVVDGSVESIRQAIEQITGDSQYRHRLERGARDYYDRFLSPQRVLERIIERLLERKPASTLRPRIDPNLSSSPTARPSVDADE